MLVIGKPKLGKTTLARLVEQKADIEHIELGKLIGKIITRMKELEETPEQDAEGNPVEMVESLGALEFGIVEDLKNGRKIENGKLVKLVNKALAEKSVAMRGFVLDLPLGAADEDGFCWVDAILTNKIILPKIQCRYFSHIVELDDTDEEVIRNAGLQWSNIETGKVYSEWNREELRKPLTTSEEEQPPELTEEEEKERAMKDEDMVVCAGE